MNRRIRKPASKADEAYLRYLKPGALAQLRDSRIIARSHRAAAESQIYLHRTSPPHSSSPPRSPIAGQPPTAPMDDLPCFVGRICGPKFPQRKKLLAAKSVFFLSSTPATPVSDAPNPIIDVYILRLCCPELGAISKATMKSFCKNARKLIACRYRPIKDEFSSPIISELQRYLTDEEYSAMVEDISRLKTTSISLLNDVGCNGSTLTEDLINEMCRYGAAELHAIAAFIGGVVSQEVIKLITRQFVPMSGTFIFNAIDHKSQLRVTKRCDVSK